MSKYEVLSIDYYNEFKCIGIQCDDHCCKSWRVDIDKKTYQAYKKLPVNEFSKLLNKNVKRNRSSSTDFRYGKFNMIDGKCPMLSEERLCNVYKELGEKNMCYTCRTYPRTFNKVDSRIERTLVISCPEVARNILLRENLIEFDLQIEEIDDEMNIVNFINTDKEKWFNRTREFCIEIIQYRDISIENRLIIMGLFLKEIDIEVGNKINNEIDIIIDKCRKNIIQGVYNNVVDELVDTNNYEVQLEFINNLFLFVTNKKFNSLRYLENFIAILNKLDLVVGEKENILERYTTCYEKEYSNFMKKHDYIYENYLVMYMFKNLFPSNTESVFEAYINLVVQFAIIKMNLVGLCGVYGEEMNTQKVAELIQSYSAMTEHDSYLPKKVREYLKENGWDTLAHMIIIIGK